MAEKTLWQKIYEDLSEPIPIDAVQTKDFGDKAQGYNIAYLIERLNNVLNSYSCTWDQELLPISQMDLPEGDPEHGKPVFFLRDVVTSTYKGNATTKESVAVHLKISIKDPEGKVLQAKESFGGCQFLNNSLGDTLKGAQTDAMKKVFGYFGLGDDAYKGVIHNQLRGFRYKLNQLIVRIRDVLKETHGLSDVKDKVLMRFICSVVEKEYDGPYNITEEDMEVLHKALDELEKGPKKPKKPSKKKVKNESKSKDGEDKVPTPEDEVDNPFSNDDEPPF